MNHLYQNLIERYPRLYRELKYIECGPGWYKIIDELSDKLEELIEKECQGSEFVPYACQVKEKFGALRFYLSTETDSMSEAVREAELKSETACENCGCSAHTRGTVQSCLYTLCDDCAAEAGLAVSRLKT